jgi:molybdenum cofactor biosynthesis enzyme MoaA
MALQEKFKGILKAEGFTLEEIEAVELRFEFPDEVADDYCSNCHARLVTKTGKIHTHAVSYFGQSIPFIQAQKTHPTMR